MAIFIIAEAGVNHNGDPDMAFRLVDAAVSAGANAIKFQTFKAENLVTKDAAKAQYQIKNTDADESQFQMLKRLELSHEAHRDLVSYCKERKIEFLSSAFDLESLNFLVSDLGLNKLKIPSGDVTNGPLLLEFARTGCALILSTGMSTLAEIEQALAVIAYGLVDASGKGKSRIPSLRSFREVFSSDIGKELLQEKVSLLHCTTEYPARSDEINLKAMETLRQAFALNTGYSDHSEGIVVPIAAASLGARILEKHFTLNRDLVGPDHAASLEPDELKEMITSIRTVEKIMGDGLKKPTFTERQNEISARKSLVARIAIKAGDYFDEKNVVIRRPGSGVSPMRYWEYMDQCSQRDYVADEVIF